MPDLTVCSAGEAAILGLHPVPGWRPRAPDATHGREDKNARKYRCFVRDCAEFDPGAIGAGNTPSRLFIGYAIDGGLMIAGGIVELLLGVAAERKELEQIARPADRHHRDPAPAGADAESSLLAPPAVGVIQVYPGTIPYIRAVRGKGLPTAVVSSTNTTVNGTDIAVKDVADLLDGTGQPDRNAR
jgi:hypothetical protein